MAKEKIRIDKINAPYNFVPLNEMVVIPEWGGEISQDLPFSDGEDGCIDVIVSNLSPIITCDDKSEKNNEGKYVRCPAHVEKDEEKHYYLPGSGLKGMLRNVLEIMTFGKMQQYNDDFFGYRDFTGKDSVTKDYPKKMLDENIHSGWLRLEISKDGSERCVISECSYRKIESSQLQHYFSEKDWHEFEKLDAFKKRDFFKAKCGNEHGILNVENSGVDISGDLVCTGYMNGKIHEYCFFNRTDNVLQLREEVVRKFITVYRPSKCYGEEIKKRMRDGNEIPVFFRKDADGQVESLGITRFYRYPFKHNVGALVGEEHEVKRCEMDMAECIFGCIKHSGGQEKALRGRVQVGNAFICSPLSESVLGKEVTGVLGQPSASYYPLYVDQRKAGKYRTYDTDGARIAGRKRYRVHKNGYLSELPKGNGNENTITRFRPLKPGLQFHFKIRVHNLRPEEIGALLSALTFHGSGMAHHNFGLAKSFGYGKLQLDEVKLTGFIKTEKEYMQMFEAYMNGFVPNWCNSDQIKQLIRIASDHKEGSDIEMMNLEEYKNFKKKFSQLQEGCETCKSLVDIEYLRKYYAVLLEKCQQLTVRNLFGEAKKQLLKYESIIGVSQIEVLDEIKRKESEYVQRQKNEIEMLIDKSEFDEAQSLLEKCRQSYPAVVGWVDLQSLLYKKFFNFVSEEVKRLCDDGKKEEAHGRLDEYRHRYPGAGPWQTLQIRIDKIKTTEPTSPIELDLTGYKYTSFEAFRNKIEKVRKSRPLEAKEIKQIIAVVEGFGADGKVKAKLKKNRDWKLFDNGNAWRYLKSVIGEDCAKDLYDKIAIWN